MKMMWMMMLFVSIWMSGCMRHSMDAEEVIYTARSKAVLLASPNEDAYVEDFGTAPPNVHAAAFWAMRADIMERV